jgi:hypothetical protein
MCNVSTVEYQACSWMLCEEAPIEQDRPHVQPLKIIEALLFPLLIKPELFLANVYI